MPKFEEPEYWREERINRFVSQAGDMAREFTFEAFNPSDITKDAFLAAKNWSPSKENFYFWGPPGSGKTHLGIAAVSIYWKFVNSTFIYPNDLARRIRSIRGAEMEASALNEYINSPLLMIDDLGAEKDTEYMVSLLLEIVNKRYMKKCGGFILTSNLSLDHLAAKLNDDRISSRLVQMCKVFSFEGEPDHRLDKRS